MQIGSSTDANDLKYDNDNEQLEHVVNIDGWWWVTTEGMTAAWWWYMAAAMKIVRQRRDNL